jgi:hypothetical protein
MVESKKARESGKTGGQEVAQEAARLAEKIEESSDVVTVAPTDIEQHRRFRTPGFQRMRLDWSHEDSVVMTRAHKAAETKIQAQYHEAYHILNQFYDIVRTPVLIRGEVQRDGNGWVVWEKDEYGYPYENWDKLTHSAKDHFLFKIITRLFTWEQMAVESWGEAMMAKGVWEEKMSIEFDKPMAGTVNDREAAGRIGSADERYFAIFLTMCSRRADAVVRSMTLISQRLKDSLASG